MGQIQVDQLFIANSKNLSNSLIDKLKQLVKKLGSRFKKWSWAKFKKCTIGYPASSSKS